MKQKILNVVIILLATLSVLAANTNNVQVQVYLTDVQQEELKFLRDYYGSTNTLKNFSTNVTVAVVWSLEALNALQMRRDRIWQATATNTAVNMNKIESDLSLSPLTNSINGTTNQVIF